MNRAAWERLPGAPARGTVIAQARDVPANGLLSLDLDGFPLLLVASAEGLRGFFNACPHQYLPLDWRRGNVLSSDGNRLRCSNHGWVFDADTGAGATGDAEGCTLDPVPIFVMGDAVVIGDPA